MKTFIEKYNELVKKFARNDEEDIKYFMGDDIKKVSRDRCKNTIFSVYEIVKGQNPAIPDPHPFVNQYGLLYLTYSKGDGKNTIDIGFEVNGNVYLTSKKSEKSIYKTVQSNNDVIKEVLEWWQNINV